MHPRPQPDPALKIFLSGTSLLTAYGGPAYSVSRLAAALVAEGADVGLWAPDGSAMTSPLVLSGSRVTRLGGSLGEAIGRFGRPDVLHDNGLWRRHNHESATIAARLKIPRVVSSRGMLEPWALDHKGFKKRIAWRLYQKRDLVRASVIHATTERETENLERLELGVPVRAVANGVDLPDLSSVERPEKALRTALFLGRIYPVKGLPMLIDAWAKVRPYGWRLMIAGPDEAGHRAEIQQAVHAQSLGDVVSFSGQVDGEEKRRAMIDADLFVLPTHSESFGMAIAEALAYGLPVLTTTGAPWPLLSERNCGWRVAPRADALAKGLRTATSLSSATLRSMGANGRKLVGNAFQWNEVARQMLALYRTAIEIASAKPRVAAEYE